MIARSRRALGSLVAEYRDAARRFTRNARLLLGALAVQSAAVGMLTTVFAIYVKSSGLSEAVVGDVEGALALASAAVCLLAPPLVAVLGYRRLMLLAAIGYGVARLGQAAMPGALPLLAFGVLYGLGEGVMQTAPVPFITENSTPTERPHLYTADLVVRVAFAMVGGLIGGVLPLVLSAALGEVGAYQATVAVAGVLLIGSSLLIWPMHEAVGHPRHAFARYLQTARDFSSWAHVRRLLIPQVLISVGAGLIIPFLSLYLKRQLGASIVQIGVIQGVSALAMGVAALAAPALARRFGFVRATAMSQAASIPFLASIPLLTSLPVAAVVFWARGAFMNMSWPIWNQYTMEAVPARERPIVAGVIAFGYSVSWLAGSALGGRLMAYSYTAPYVIATALYTFGALATWLLLRKHEDLPVRVASSGD